MPAEAVVGLVERDVRPMREATYAAVSPATPEPTTATRRGRGVACSAGLPKSKSGDDVVVGAVEPLAGSMVIAGAVGGRGVALEQRPSGRRWPASGRPAPCRSPGCRARAGRPCPSGAAGISSVTMTALLSELGADHGRLRAAREVERGAAGVVGREHARLPSAAARASSSHGCCQTTPPGPIATTAAAAARKRHDAAAPARLEGDDGGVGRPRRGHRRQRPDRGDAGEHPVAQLGGRRGRRWSRQAARRPRGGRRPRRGSRRSRRGGARTAARSKSSSASTA